MAGIRDIMTTDVVSVHPETSVFEAHDLIAKHNLDGVPVVDEQNKLVGILTEYDLLTKGSAIHLPTLQKVLTELPVARQDRTHFRDSVEEIMKLTVRDVMNSDPLTIADDATIEQTIATFRSHHRVNPIPIIDKEKRVVGVVSRYDVLKLFAMLRMNATERSE